MKKLQLIDIRIDLINEDLPFYEIKEGRFLVGGIVYDSKRDRWVDQAKRNSGKGYELFKMLAKERINYFAKNF